MIRKLSPQGAHRDNPKQRHQPSKDRPNNIPRQGPPLGGFPPAAFS